MPDQTHIVFATTGPYSHAPPLLRLARVIVETDPDILISVILHINNVPNAENILSSVENGKKDRIKLCACGTQGSLKDITKSYTDMLFHSGPQYASILADTTRPCPSVFLFDITSFFYVQIKASVEANFPHLKPPKVVGYSPQPACEVLVANGSEENGSIRWFQKALKEKGIDPLDMNLPKTPEDLAQWAENTAEIVKKGKIIDQAFTCSDRLIDLPGLPPLHTYEYWSIPIDWSTFEYHGLMQYFAGMQLTAYLPEAWVFCFPSDVFEPKVWDIIQTDEVISMDGKKQVISLGWIEDPLKDLEENIKGFLDGFEEKSVVFIGFGTVVDAGQGVNVLFDLLVDLNTPFVFAGGNQLSSLPQSTRHKIQESVGKGQAIAPEWCDQVGILHHPSILCFISHCGANSTMEAIYAQVPILTWSRRMDQILIGSQIGTQKLGIELIQHREGFGVNKKVAHLDKIVSGQPDSLREEIKAALEAVKGEEGAVIRGNLKEMVEKMREKRGGVWDENVRKFIELARSP